MSNLVVDIETGQSQVADVPLSASDTTGSHHSPVPSVITSSQSSDVPANTNNSTNVRFDKSTTPSLSTGAAIKRMSLPSTLSRRSPRSRLSLGHTAPCSPSTSYASSLNKMDIQTASAIIESPPPPSWDKVKASCGKDKVRPKAVRFAARMSAALTLSSLFVFIPGYPQGTWVYITALMVSWFPSLDAASVIKKTIQRIQGTILGAIMGVVVGYLSLVIDTNQGQAKQAAFLGVTIALTTFVYTFLFVQYRYISSHSYAGLVGLMTFAISYEPFYTDSGTDCWRKAILRIVNVILGCVIGGIVSLVVFPKSTAGLVRDNLKLQVNLAGEASQAVMLWSSKVFAGNSSPAFLGSVLTECRNASVDEGEEDEDDVAAYNAYTKAMKQWKDTKGLFPLMEYDAHMCCSRKWRFKKEEKKTFCRKGAIVLARAFRLRTTAVLLHSIARNDQGHDFIEDELETFAHIGHLLGSMLKFPFDDNCEDFANELLDQLVHIRQFALDKVSIVAEDTRAINSGGTSTMTLMRDALRLRLAEGDGQMPLSLHSSDNSSLLFLQLVEHLCLRSLRLYYAANDLLGET